MSILLTGGLGYIGSHTAVVLSEAGFEVVLYDNLSNSKRSVLDRLEGSSPRSYPRRGIRWSSWSRDPTCRRQTSNNLSVWASIPLAASMTMMALSAAVSVR